MKDLIHFGLIVAAVAGTLAYIAATVYVLLDSDTWKGRVFGLLMVALGFSLELFLCAKYI